ncbi:MAG: hypothetical protein V3T70_03750, partial [Phycisphaerae bacterium]
DSVPFDMVRDSWRLGRFRFACPPVRVLSPFPVMTDLSLSEFFGISPVPGVEAAYYDGARLTDGYEVYAGDTNGMWPSHTDYRMTTENHLLAYMWPHPWLDHELRRIQDIFLLGRAPTTIGYVVGTSAAGARFGRNGHQSAMIRIDRFCQAVVHRTRGRARLTLFSDHGHCMGDSRRIELAEVLVDLGYRTTTRLEKPGDVVAPEFGLVSCAAVYTQQPEAVARDLVGVEGIELTAYRGDDDSVIVLGRAGTAAITKTDAGFRYDVVTGDPLNLMPILNALSAHDRPIPDRSLFDATRDHEFPDAVQRLWRAFHGLVEHVPDVYVSTRDGYYCGSPLVDYFVDLVGVHGNLRAAGSFGFAMTGAGTLPDVVRMEDLRSSLAALGVPLASRGAPLSNGATGSEHAGSAWNASNRAARDTAGR